MTDSEERETDQRGKKPSRRPSRGEGESRGRSRISTNTWNDGIDRALCEAMPLQRAEAWPVNHRTDLAEAMLLPVDLRPGEILLCTGDHDGPHLWPAIDPADD